MGFVMFHHSSEHLAEPLEALPTFERLLAKGRRCLVRTPTVSSLRLEALPDGLVAT